MIGGYRLLPARAEQNAVALSTLGSKASTSAEKQWNQQAQHSDIP